MFRSFLFVPLLFCLFATLWAQEEVLIPVPFYVDDVYSGEITLKINGNVQIQPRPLLEELRPQLNENSLDAALSRWTPEEWVPYETLSGSLIQADFDDSLLIFTVTIPPESRRPGTFSFVREIKAPPGKLTSPSELSGILNLEGWSRFDYEDRYFNLRLQPELAVNYGGSVMETRGNIQTGGDPLALDYLRFVREFDFLTARAEAGDLTYSADGFLPENMVGLSFFRKTALDLNYQSRPEMGRTIFFPDPADVEIRINDRMVRKQSVPAGTWTFKNFPLNSGPNEVVILWTDSQGTEHRESFFQIYDSGLLKEEELDWGGSFGTDSWTTVNPALLFHLSNGVTDTFTAGFSTYYDWNGGLFSLEAPLLLASPFGTFNLVPSASLTMGEGYEWGLSLNHSFSEQRKGYKRQNFGSSLSFSMESYGTASQTISLRAYYVYLPLTRLSITPALNWSYEAVEPQNSFSFSLRFRTSSSDGSSVSADLGVTMDEGVWSPTAAITYSASFPDIQQNFYARGDLSGQKMNVAWNRYNRSDGDTDYTLGASSIIPANNEDRFTLTLNGGFIHPQFNANLSQGLSAFFATNEYSNSTSLSAGTALVYADGVLGITRPVRNSFVIFQSDIGPLSVNPTSLGSLLEVEGGEPAVLSSVSPYRYTTFRLMPDSLPVGSDINDYTTSVYPTYRSGTLIRAEEKVYMYAGGILNDGDIRPLSLILGEITPYSELDLTYEKGEWPREFFTDEKGYFECYGLTPGEYLLTQRDKGLTYKVEVTVDESGFCDLGVVSPEK